MIRWQRTLPAPCDATASAPRALRRRHGAMQAGSLADRSVAEKDVMEPSPGLFVDAWRVGHRHPRRPCRSSSLRRRSWLLCVLDGPQVLVHGLATDAEVPCELGPRRSR